MSSVSITKENNLWLLSSLSAEQSNFVEYLLLSQKNTVVARYDTADDLLPGLVEKGLLQTPTGVGTVSLLKLTTTFRVPIAVWKALNKRNDSATFKAPLEHSNWLLELENQFKKRIDVLVESAEIAPKDKWITRQKYRLTQGPLFYYAVVLESITLRLGH